MPDRMRHQTDALEHYMLNMTRRRFFGTTARTLGAGLGSAALGSLLGSGAIASGAGMPPAFGPENAPGRVFPPHHAPKAKHVIYLHMEGAPSQLDLYDYKPQLRERFDQDLPDSVIRGQRFTTMTSGQTRFPVAPSKFAFHRHQNNEDGVWLSELLPYTGSIAKDMCLIRSMHTEAINHEPGITFFQTGTQQPGRPSFGSWVSYGLGCESQDLPSFVVLISQGFGNMQALSARFWGSGFLPSEHQGCKLRAGRDAVLYLRDPEGVKRQDRRKMLDLVTRLNAEEFEETLDPEVQARIAQYEMAYRMQMSVPELTDLTTEDPGTLEMYGPEVHKPGTFSANCLLARRLVERGVRFVQLYMRGWDQHNNLPGELAAQCNAVDRAQAALVTDLKRRGLLDETLVIWSGEFGRTVYSQGTLTKENYGRDHHPRCFSMWMAGGGIKPGISYGKTDDYSYNIVENPVAVHDLHATLLHLLGLDHERLIYRHQGRDYRLTDVSGDPIRSILA